METRMVELTPVLDTISEWDGIERAIIELFRKEIYLPLIKTIGGTSKTLSNSNNDLLEAIRTGRISFYRGKFTGKLNAGISKDLKALGAMWDRKTGTFKLPTSSLPYDVRSAISASYSTYQQKMRKVDDLLAQNLPEQIADKLNTEKFFDSALWKTEKGLQQSMQKISVGPQLTPERRKIIAEEWSGNMKLWVKNFTEEEIKTLRKDLEKSIFAGNRYETAVASIQKSYGVSERKAKFLARQETSLALAKFKEARYADSGVQYYKWGCVAGTKQHPVRPSHKALEGKVFRWDDPPITTMPGEPQRRNNPHQDYNCRCFAIPLVGHKEIKE